MSNMSHKKIAGETFLSSAGTHGERIPFDGWDEVWGSREQQVIEAGKASCTLNKPMG